MWTPDWPIECRVALYVDGAGGPRTPAESVLLLVYIVKKQFISKVSLGSQDVIERVVSWGSDSACWWQCEAPAKVGLVPSGCIRGAALLSIFNWPEKRKRTRSLEHGLRADMAATSQPEQEQQPE